ncbi:craniofacial development protein 2-like [Drosophila biarmipes]|uniref:craniofacial development protein 2-like n=1 Tax=Drosophila biarmipes TaxID=125945 RepID=UPI0021CC5915|nr:craniofacial development protein 2-like [Drosophila biarmipes]
MHSRLEGANGFSEMHEYTAGIRVKARFFNLSIICAHAPTEEKDDAVKDSFYARLAVTYDRCPDHDVMLILGDFNAKVGRERFFDPTVGRFSLHETTSNDGLRLIDFAATRNMVVSSTRFRHLEIHKATWLSPD